MEGAYLSGLRTASVTMLAANLLKGRDIERVAIIGSGALAQAHLNLLIQSLLSLRSIQLFDLDQQRANALWQSTAAALKMREVAFQQTATAEEAIRGAQLIIPVTTTTLGYIQYDWLQPGAILVNVSLDDPLPEVVMRADSVIVDDWKLVKNDDKRLIGRMYRAGQVIGPDDALEAAENRRRIDAQLGEIVLGTKVGRRSVDDIILVNPFGLAIEDVALAAHVYRVACDFELGVWLKR